MTSPNAPLKRGGALASLPDTRLPEDYLPSDEELIELVREHRLVCLRELAALLWPALLWRPLTPNGDSITGDLRVFPSGRGTKRQTTAQYLCDRMQDLVVLGRLRFGPARRDEADKEAQVSYVCPNQATIASSPE